MSWPALGGGKMQSCYVKPGSNHFSHDTSSNLFLNLRTHRGCGRCTQGSCPAVPPQRTYLYRQHWCLFQSCELNSRAEVRLPLRACVRAWRGAAPCLWYDNRLRTIRGRGQQTIGGCWKVLNPLKHSDYCCYVPPAANIRDPAFCSRDAFVLYMILRVNGFCLSKWFLTSGRDPNEGRRGSLA